MWVWWRLQQKSDYVSQCGSFGQLGIRCETCRQHLECEVVASRMTRMAMRSQISQTEIVSSMCTQCITPCTLPSVLQGLPRNDSPDLSRAGACWSACSESNTIARHGNSRGSACGIVASRPRGNEDFSSASTLGKPRAQPTHVTPVRTSHLFIFFHVL